MTPGSIDFSSKNLVPTSSVASTTTIARKQRRRLRTLRRVMPLASRTDLEAIIVEASTDAKNNTEYREIQSIVIRFVGLGSSWNAY
mmetsp:Transcript_15811/g.33233  ORF Transcript_15811/g.33233 Transcript_15811/m.33233 type:complete len:86 (+) Transcript_15811:1117-1374(+)